MSRNHTGDHNAVHYFTRAAKRQYLLATVTCTAILMVAGCNKSTQVEEPDSEPVVQESSLLDLVQPDETVLATVNGTRIGEQDLSVNMVRTLGDSYFQLVDSSVEDKILQSMIASRAIAAEALSLMDDDEKIALEKRVALFREELLVKDYLLNNADPHTITSEKIEAYYTENPDEFQGHEERLYELVTVSTASYKQNAKVALDTLQLAKNHDDWRDLSAQLRREQHAIGLSHSYQTLQPENSEKSTAKPSALNSAVAQLQVGDMSRVIIQDGAPYLVRLLEVKKGEAIPLSQARATIKRKLLPASVRQSVREISDTVLAKSEVVVVDSAQNSQ